MPLPLEWKIHREAFFRFDAFYYRPSGHPLGCAALWRQFCGGQFFFVRRE
jgi:hypothetical protein